jgi:8-oxo-dGTP pyrophosphatase MutT (NUDIX family)
MPREIHIAAAVIVRTDGKLLLVRKRGSTVFMQPGGKLEPGETPIGALLRELEEEIGFADPSAAPRYLGRFEAIAANEADARVIAETYVIETEQPPAAQAEIEDLRWIDPWASTADMAPLTRDYILPAYRQTLGR